MNTFTSYVHETRAGRWAVGEWDQDRAQYTCPLTDADRKATGCHTAFARRPDDFQYSLPTRRQALALARRLFGPVMDARRLYGPEDV